MRKIDWPSREEWARRERTAYFDDAPTASLELLRYANAEEVEAAVVALKALWAERGREMKAVQAGPLSPQPGERNRQYYERWKAMSKSDQDTAHKAGGIKHQRREINEIIKELRNGRVPQYWSQPGTGSPTPPPALALIVARHSAATAAEVKAWEERIAATPIDDEAWERHLEWRRMIDGTGGIIIK